MAAIAKDIDNLYNYVLLKDAKMLALALILSAIVSLCSAQSK